MFVGHYGPSFAVKALDRSIPLWLLFIAVQFVDVLWGVFVLLGIEKVRIVPGITATNPLDLYYMPYTHSLVAATVWAGVAAIGYRFVPKLRSWGAAFLVAAAVLSHWILDLLVHAPDLPLYDDTAKVGFGLWNYPVLAFLLEAGLLFAGIFLYFNTAKGVTSGGRSGMIIFACIMLAVQGLVFFGPPPSSDQAAAGMALIAYVTFGGVAYWLEKKWARQAHERRPTL